MIKTAPERLRSSIVLEILKSLLSGETLPKHWEDCVTKGHDEAELDFDFRVWFRMFGALRRHGNLCLFVINNRSAGVIAMGAGLPFNFRTDTALGSFMLRLDEPAVLPAVIFNTISQIIDTINAASP